jgi:hypothetical protein
MTAATEERAWLLSGRRLRRKVVSVNRAAFHDEIYFSHHGHVFKRISRDRNQIRQLACLNRA